MATSSSSSSSSPSPPPPRRRSVIIVGAGIVGSTLGRLLGERGHKVTLIDRGEQKTFVGSTGLAPGFVAPFHTLDTLRTLGQRSALHYQTVPDGFALVGGLEVAFTPHGEEELRARFTLALEKSINAEWLTAEQAIQREPRLLRRRNGQQIIAALFFPDAGTANATAITQFEQEKACRTSDVEYVQATVVSVSPPGSVQTLEQGTFRADDVVVCAGIWAREVLPEVPCYAVAHPYMYSREHRETKDRNDVGRSPFIRFLEHHVYARDHGRRFGFGTYGHAPIHVDKAFTDHRHLGGSAKGVWQEPFASLLRQEARKTLAEEAIHAFGLQDDKDDGEETFPIHSAFNGIFSVTPDAKPLAGLVAQASSEEDAARLFCCVAVWVTHAFGTANLMADLLDGKVAKEDRAMVHDLNPLRFDGQSDAELQRRALSTYNDIYVKEGE